MKILMVLLSLSSLMAGPTLTFNQMTRKLQVAIDKYENVYSDLKKLEDKLDTNIDDLYGNLLVNVAYIPGAMFLSVLLNSSMLKNYSLLHIIVIAAYGFLDFFVVAGERGGQSDEEIYAAMREGCNQALGHLILSPLALGGVILGNFGDFMINGMKVVSWNAKRREMKKKLQRLNKFITFLKELEQAESNKKRKKVWRQYFQEKNSPEGMKVFRKLLNTNGSFENTMPAELSYFQTRHGGPTLKELAKALQAAVGSTKNSSKMGNRFLEFLYEKTNFRSPYVLWSTLLVLSRLKENYEKRKFITEIDEFEKEMDAKVSEFRDRDPDPFVALRKRGLILTDPITTEEIRSREDLAASVRDLADHFPELDVQSLEEKLNKVADIIYQLPPAEYTLRLSKLRDELPQASWPTISDEESLRMGISLFDLFKSTVPPGEVKNEHLKKTYKNEDAFLFTLAAIFNRSKDKDASDKLGPHMATDNNPYPSSALGSSWKDEKAGKLNMVIDQVLMEGDQKKIDNVIQELVTSGGHCNDDRGNSVDFLYDLYCEDSTKEEPLNEIFNRSVNRFKAKSLELAIYYGIERSGKLVKEEGNTVMTNTYNRYRNLFGLPKKPSIFSNDIKMTREEVYENMNLKNLTQALGKDLALYLKIEYLEDLQKFIDIHQQLVHGYLGKEGYILPGQNSLPPTK